MTDQAPAASAHYVIVHAPGPQWNPALGFREQPGVQAHVGYYGSLRERGLLDSGGPFLDDSGGMMIVLAPSLAAAIALAEADPAIQAGLLSFTIKPWIKVFV